MSNLARTIPSPANPNPAVRRIPGGRRSPEPVVESAPAAAGPYGVVIGKPFGSRMIAREEPLQAEIGHAMCGGSGHRRDRRR